MTRQLIPWTNRIPATLEEMRRQLDEALGNWLGEGGDGKYRFVPQANLAETDKQFEITVDLPGLKPAEVKVELQGDELWISGERKEEKEERGKTYHHFERCYGEFRRTIPLAVPVKADKIEASFKDGVLTVIVPKAESARTRRIEVRT
jgi:HSP20 family protein